MNEDEIIKQHKLKRDTRIAGTCVHFNGIQKGKCRALVSYSAVTDKDWPTWPRNPCIQWPDKPTVPDNCQHRRLPTPQEIDAEVREIDASIGRVIKALEDLHEHGTCIHCGQDARPLEQVGRCVYGACGHRQYQGKLP